MRSEILLMLKKVQDMSIFINVILSCMKKYYGESKCTIAKIHYELLYN